MRGLLVAGLHDYSSALLKQPTLVFCTRDLLDCIPMLVEARECSPSALTGQIELIA